jgi:acetyl-CoA carboxylase biotin carboxyl carrier protein
VSINYSELRELLQAIAQTDISELVLKSEDFELTVRKGLTREPLMTPELPVLVPKTDNVALTSGSAVGPPNATETTEPVIEKKWVAITSPMVGTFYRAPAPGESPFVSVNERIRLGQVVCIIEAMKLMNEIECEVSGQIVDIVIENGEPVEYGQTLMWVNPDS